MKRLLVFCDGTGQDGLIVPDAPTEDEDEPNDFEKGTLNALRVIASQPGLYQESEVTGGTLNAVSNILRLSRAVKQTSSDGQSRQIVYYQSGVGTEADFAGEINIANLASQAFGVIVASKIRNAYAFVAQNYEEGDEILLFGFSRGAYTARKIAGLIDKIGLLQPEALGIFFNIWKDLVDGKVIQPPAGTRFPRIKCIGVFDTVGSVYKQINALEIVDASLPHCVDIALHAISLQENREKFLPTLFNPPPVEGQTLIEVWFPGAHSDVGGSYPRHELADISLFWMTGEIMARSLFALDERFIERSKQTNPDAWGTSQPHNSYYETPYAKRPFVGHQTRLASGQINEGIVFHQSWQFSPPLSNITHSDYMVARDTLPFANLTFAALNDFERGCKERWNDNLGDPQGGLKDNIGVLFPGELTNAPYTAPYITFANRATLPDAPQGLKYAWLTDPDLLDRDNTRVPIFLYGPYLYTVFADDDNSYTMYIVAWDIYQREVKRVEKPGARYIWQIQYDADAGTVTFIGQASRSVTATLQELTVDS